jgi:CRP-like cAMP-binding protein
MTDPVRTIVQNRLLQAMSSEDMGLLQPFLEPVTLSVNDFVVEPNLPIEHVYFLQQGVCSVVVIGAHKNRIEVSDVGREGMTGAAVILGMDRSPNLTCVTVAGSALRMLAEDLRSVMEVSPSLRSVLLRYIHTMMMQRGNAVFANGHFTVKARLARWILMCHDRLDTDEFPLTHAALSLRLGVRRAGVTMAMHLLEGEHMIRSTRGYVKVLDRSKLKTMAGDSYGSSEAEYNRVLGPEPQRSNIQSW